MPGVGISIGLTRLFSQLIEHGIVTAGKNSMADALVIPFSTNEISEALKVAEALRKANVNTDIMLADISIKRKFKYADRLGVARVVVVGEEEIKEQKFTLQDMKTGSKDKLPLEQIVEIVAGEFARS
jgi:histidyl-tRNA synthetase